MPSKPVPKDYSVNLVSGNDAMRLATLERMRGKLAGRSVDVMAREERERKITRGRRLSWGWRIALAVLFFAANAGVIVMAGGSKAEAAVVKEKRAPAVLPPKNLSLNDQALYWT